MNMFFSSSSSTSSSDSSSASSASSSSAASSSSSNMPPSSPNVSSESKLSHWQEKGAAGLGVISSMSPECTPLKHRYDSCFDTWFKDYLAIGDDQILAQQQQGTTKDTAEVDQTVPKKKSGWFSSDPTTSSSGPSSYGLSDPEIEQRKRNIMERYDRDCGNLFRDYQACVKKAISERGLDDLIQQARKENPFPFDHQRAGDPRKNNPPFPFPAARD